MQPLYISLIEMNKNQQYTKLLAPVRDRYGVCGISQEEERMVVNAMNSKKGTWHLCPNGHLYNIGQCGGAMEQGRCPECDSTIGGSDHSLLESNSRAMLL